MNDHNNPPPETDFTEADMQAFHQWLNPSREAHHLRQAFYAPVRSIEIAIALGSLAIFTSPMETSMNISTPNQVSTERHSARNKP